MNTKPEVGQWWVNVFGDPPIVHKTGIVLFVGKDSKGRLLWEDCQGHIETDYGCDWSDWHHEHTCTGWDWVPEEVFPQWYVSDKWEGTAYIKRVDAQKAVRVALDGKEKDEKPWSQHGKECLAQGWYKQTTQADAEARVTKKLISPDAVNDLAVSLRKETTADVVESPDDWVTQDRVPPRFLIDEVRWVWKCRTESTWNPVGSPGFTIKHGFVDVHNDRFEVRCRRRDLPGVEKPKTSIVTVYEVVYGDELEEMTPTFCCAERDLIRLREAFKYVSVVSTKTVEVML